ncbi:MAG: hypothetical protein J6J15_05520 [Oscillospiraceae bacterium]|nr:hypothetical protein [Oscillospiraceae bacterium]
MEDNEIIDRENDLFAVGVPLLRHMEYIPAFFAIPKELFEGTWNDILKLPRVPAELVLNEEYRRIIESDIFLNFLMNSYAAMIWPLFCRGKNYEALSPYEPTKYLLSCFPLWAKELTEMGFIPTLQDMMIWHPFNIVYYPSAMEVEEAIYVMMRKVDEKYKFSKIKKLSEEMPCFEDFRQGSYEIRNFFRNWYHTRTKHPMISLEDFRKTYEENHDGIQWDVEDESRNIDENVEEYVTSQILVDNFKATLGKKDLEILEMRMDGYTLESIAEKLGYKNHSGVLKRIRKIGLAYQKFTGEDFGFESRKII